MSTYLEFEHFDEVYEPLNVEVDPISEVLDQKSRTGHDLLFRTIFKTSQDDIERGYTVDRQLLEDNGNFQLEPPTARYSKGEERSVALPRNNPNKRTIVTAHIHSHPYPDHYLIPSVPQDISSQIDLRFERKIENFKYIYPTVSAILTYSAFKPQGDGEALALIFQNSYVDSEFFRDGYSGGVNKRIFPGINAYVTNLNLKLRTYAFDDHFVVPEKIVEVLNRSYFAAAVYQISFENKRLSSYEVMHESRVPFESKVYRNIKIPGRSIYDFYDLQQK